MHPVPRLALQPFLTRLLLRSALDGAERQAILQLPIKIDRVHAGVDFVRMGDHLSHACLVVDGLVGRFEQTARGDRQTTALYIPGDMADLQSVVLPKTSWALQTLSLSMIGKIPHAALVAVADRHPAVARALWRDGAVDAAILAMWSVGLGRRQAEARVAHLICELKSREQAVGRFVDNQFSLPMTQNQLADVLGLTAVHVNRMIGALRDAMLITMAGGRVTILDWKNLVATADFDAAYLHLERQDYITPQ
jgi:CRP-like cAMP-binding protein